MIPVRTSDSNFVYRGPTPDIGDAWCERVPVERAVYIEWQLTPEDVETIAAGGLIRLGIYGMEPIPPVSIGTTRHRPLSDVGATLRDRALDVLRGLVDVPPDPRPSWRPPAGHWIVSSDVWQALNDKGALEASHGVPTLHHRPLIEVAGADPNTLEFAVQII